MPSRKMRMPLDEREILANLELNGKQALMHLLNELITSMDIRLAEKTLTVGRENEILYDKARIEGARGLKKDLNAYLKALIRASE